MLPNAPKIVPPFHGRSKNFALLDNITICDRVVGRLGTPFMKSSVSKDKYIGQEENRQLAFMVGR